MPASTDLARRKLATGLASLGEANEILGNLDNAAKTNESNTFTAKQINNAETLEAGPTTYGLAATTNAAGSVITNAAALPAGTAPVYPVGASDNTKGVQISASDSVTGREFEILNLVGGKVLIVYPPTNGTINALSANSAYTGANSQSVFVMCYDGTNSKFRAFSST